MRYLSIIILFLFTVQVNAQVPKKMSYQAVIRDASSNLISQRNIGMQLSILKDDPNGIPVYIEVQQASTNLNGLVSIQIGKGVKILGDFNSIDWSTGSYYIKTETDPDGGFNYKIIGTSELMSVPYAFYAENSKSVFDTTSIYQSIRNLEKKSIENKNNILINLDSIKSNAAQIQFNIDDILLNTNNIKNNVESLDSKISKIDLDNLLLNYQKLGKFVTAISLLGVDSFDIKINGNLTASKNVTVGGNIEALGSTSTLGTIEKPFKGLFISSGSLSIASDTLGQDIPAAVLSNVRGNLEISAGGLKLVGNDQAFIAPRIVSNLTGNASTATKLETARTINGISFDGTNDIIIAMASANAITYTNTGTGDVPGGSYNGSLAKTISYNSIGASPLAGSTLITSVGTLAAGAIPYTLLTGTVPNWNQSTSGNAATVTTNANLTGVVTSLGNVTSIASGTITNSMIANTAVANLSGTNTGDESATTIKTKLGITTLTGSNTGDQDLPTLLSLGAVATNSAITGATKTKLTYDEKGLVISGADATTADIAVSSNKNYVTDVQAGVISNTSGTNTGDETIISLNTKLGITTLTGSNTGDENTTSIKTKLGITTLTGSNTGDQDLPTLLSLGAVATNTAITGATKTKLTYDEKGLVTAGTDATTADIAASSNKNYVTDVQAGVISNTSGTNTGDETTTSLNTKLGITTLTGSNTGDETITSLNTKLGITTLTGSNTGDESATSIKTKLGITTLTGSNTGDQDLPTLLSLGAVAKNSAITSATKTKLTYDEKGLVTSGTDATTADIAASSNKNYVTDVQAGVISNTSGTNTGDETITSLSTKLGITTLTGSNTGDENATTIKTKLGITTLTGSNTGDESATTIKTKLGITTLTGSNTGDESATSIKSKLGITTLSGINTGDQILPTLLSLGASPLEGSTSLITTGLLTSLTLSSNDSEKQTEDIDLAKTIHKLTGKDLTNYLLRDGFEGQVIYIYFHLVMTPI